MNFDGNLWARCENFLKFEPGLEHVQTWRQNRTIHLNMLKLEGTQFIWKIDEVPMLQTQKGKVVPSLNSVSLVEATYRLEFNHKPMVYDEIGPNVSHVLTAVKHGDDAFSLVRDVVVPESHLKRAVVH